MTKDEFLEYMQAGHRAANPLFRNLMDSEERRHANRLVKEGFLTKGHSDPEGLVIFYYDEGLQEAVRQAEARKQSNQTGTTMKSIFTIQLATFDRAIAAKVVAHSSFTGQLYQTATGISIAGCMQTSIRGNYFGVGTPESLHVDTVYFSDNTERDQFIDYLTEALLECANNCEAFDGIRDGKTAPVAIISDTYREIFI